MSKQLKVIELFAGIGAPRKALMRGGYNFKIVDAIEIDKYPVNSYNAIYETNISPKSITDYYPNKEEIGEIDLLWNSSPCQDISLSGKQAGAVEGSGTRSSLIYEVIRIVKEIKPKYIVWENVKGLVSKKHKPILDDYISKLNNLGYNSYYDILNAKDYGVPQNRDRVFTVSIRKDIHQNFRFPNKQDLKLNMKDVLEENVDDKYYLSHKMIDYISSTGTKNFHNHNCKINLDIARPITTIPNKRAGTTNYICGDLPQNYDLKVIRDGGLYGNKQAGSIYNKNGLCPTITTEASQNWNILINEYPKIRKLTPKECWRLMGFDDEDFEKAKKVNSDTQLYKEAGNSVVVNVIEAIFNELLKDYKSRE